MGRHVDRVARCDVPGVIAGGEPTVTGHHHVDLVLGVGCWRSIAPASDVQPDGQVGTRGTADTDRPHGRAGRLAPRCVTLALRPGLDDGAPGTRVHPRAYRRHDRSHPESRWPCPATITGSTRGCVRHAPPVRCSLLSPSWSRPSGTTATPTPSVSNPSSSPSPSAASPSTPATLVRGPAAGGDLDGLQAASRTRRRGLRSPARARMPATAAAGSTWSSRRARVDPRGTAAVLDLPYLDISDRISGGGERGLLGLAFVPGLPHRRARVR